MNFSLNLAETEDGWILWPALFVCWYEDESRVDGGTVSQIQLGWLKYIIILSWN